MDPRVVSREHVLRRVSSSSRLRRFAPSIIDRGENTGKLVIRLENA